MNEEDRDIGFVQIEEFEHENVVRAKRRPFTNSAKLSTFPPLYLEANIPSLGSILRTRFLLKQHFRQDQILNIAESVVYGLAYLEERNLILGDVHTSNVFYDQLNDLFKVGNPYFTESGFKQLKKGRMSYLAPEQLDNAGKEVLSHKADIYSLGAMLLQLCTLESSETIYRDMRVQQEEVQRKLRIVESLYSRRVAELVAMCLTPESVRPTPKQLAVLLYEASKVFGK